MQGLGRLSLMSPLLHAFCANVLLNGPDLDEFLHELMQTFALFSVVPMILIVRAPSTLIPSISICLDWLPPSEV